MTLTAPDHIKGAMFHNTPQALRDERNAWAAKAKADGYTYNQISAALGITHSNVIRAAKAGGFVKQKAIRSRYAVTSRCGVRLGSVGETFEAMDAQTQDALINAAMKQRATIAEVLAKTFAEARA